VYTIGNSIHIRLVFQFHLYTLQQSETSLSTTCLTELFVKCIIEWLRWWIHPKCHPIVSLNLFYTLAFIKPQVTLLLQRCHCFSESSAPDSKSLQLHVHALIQNFDSCDIMSKSSDALSCLFHNTFPKL
jgi:hypothetical protein